MRSRPNGWPIRDDSVAHLDTIGVRQRQRPQRAARAGVDVQDGQVGRGVRAAHLRLHLASRVAESDHGRLGVADHVRVGDDRPVAAYHEAGAGCGSDLNRYDPRSRRLVDAADLCRRELAAAGGGQHRGLVAGSIEHGDGRECERGQRRRQRQDRHRAGPAGPARRGLGSLRLLWSPPPGFGLQRLSAPTRLRKRPGVGIACALAVDPEAGRARHPGDARQR